MTTNGLRINMNVSVTYAKANGEVKGYDGSIDEINTDSLLVRLWPEAGESKPQFRTFKLNQIKHLLILN